MKVLLTRGDVDPNEPGWSGLTPLCCAAADGHEGVVETLLGWADVDPDKPDDNGRSPVWWAVTRGHAGVVLLLQPFRIRHP